MSEISFGKMSLLVSDLGPDSTVPSIFQMKNVQQENKVIDLDEDDGLYIGFGFCENIFPYTKQDRYDRNFIPRELQTVTLENEYLKAVFFPDLGGRMWSLYDKKAGRELMLNNPELAFCNLALRDAWFCGGVEWNVGMVGHTPFTCSPLHMATLHTDDGTPVLRFYEFERIRKATYQIDFWLPDGSDRLFVGVRLHNPNNEVVPMYWWSNIAVQEDPKGRVIVPTDQAYSGLRKVRQFQHDGIDITYPVQNPDAVDYFWRTKTAEHKYVCHVGEDGYGLCQASTERQQGRKLFVWGQGPGADRWQDLLKVSAGNGHYVEIQAGLGQTQYECVPMPPKTTWEWVESYGAIQLTPEIAHGKDYAQASAEATGIVAEYNLEDVLKNATHMKKKAEKVLQSGSGWGALEEEKRQLRGDSTVNKHLDFGGLGEAQAQWISLLHEGTMGQHNPNDVPDSWMMDKDFVEKMEEAVAGKDIGNWYTWMQLGVSYVARKRNEKAEECLLRSVHLLDNVWAEYALTCLYWRLLRKEDAIRCAKKALSLKPDDVSVAIDMLNMLCANEEYEAVLQAVAAMPEAVALNGRVLQYRARACVELGQLELAEELMENNVEAISTNVREGELSVTDLWITLQKKKAIARGEEPLEKYKVPQKWNFRMKNE